MPLRIHHVIDSSNTDSGSVTPLVRGLIAELEKRGLTCSVNHAYEDPHENAIKTTRDADLVHIHGCAYPALIGAAWLAKRLQKPFVLSPAGELDPAAIRRHSRGVRWRGKLYERRLIRRAAAVLAQNKAEASALGQRYSRDVMILPYGHTAENNGTEPQTLEVDLPARLDGQCILMLAPIEPKTGCVGLLKAFAEIGPDANGWYVVIAGSDRGDYRKMLEAAIRRKGGGDRVVLAPAADESSQRALLARADALVAPSMEPGPAGSILKAAACGVPIMASRQLLPDSLSNAVVVCEADRSGIREGLRRMLKLTNQQRADLASRARSIVAAELDWRILAERYVTLYKSLA